MKFHPGPYQKMSPSGFAGFLLVAFMAFVLLSLFSGDSLKLIAIFMASFCLLALICSIWILPRVRKKLDGKSLLSKEDKVFEEWDDKDEL